MPGIKKPAKNTKKRDHRKLGKELGIFTMDDDVGPGLPLWMPNGTVIIEELEKLAKETELAAGYKRVVNISTAPAGNTGRNWGKIVSSRSCPSAQTTKGSFRLPLRLGRSS